MTLQELTNVGLIWLGDCRYGQMFYLTTDHYIGRALNLYGEFSEGEVEFFKNVIQPDWLVLDVGANMGAHTVALARLAKCVHAFEPQEVLFNILKNNVKINDLGNVVTHRACVGRGVGVISVPEVDYSKPGNYGCVAMGTGASVVPLMTVDSMNLPACQFIKADVEGMEIDVINGAVKTIAKYRPILYLENDRDDCSETLLRRLFDLDYHVYWHLPPYYNPNNLLKNSNNIYGNTISVNLICLPAAGDYPHKATGISDSWRNHV